MENHPGHALAPSHRPAGPSSSQQLVCHKQFPPCARARSSTVPLAVPGDFTRAPRCPGKGLIVAAGWVVLFTCGRLRAEGPALLPREAAPGVFVLAFPDASRSANAGWVRREGGTVLVGVPDEGSVSTLLEKARATTGQPIVAAVVLQARPEDLKAAVRLAREGIRLLIPPGSRESLVAAGLRAGEVVEEVRSPGSTTFPGLRLIPLGAVTGVEQIALLIEEAGLLFAGDACIHGPRTPLEGANTAAWIRALRTLRALEPRIVVPGRGTCGDATILLRLERFLRELRRQLGHAVAQGWPQDQVLRRVRIEPEWLVWMPYDTPTPGDLAHVYSEITVPRAPFLSDPVAVEDSRPLALAVIGDSPHEPGHLEEGLAPIFERAGVACRFAVDPRALSRENLAKVKLVVLLRDGYVWPAGPGTDPACWMSPEQERAIVELVERGGGLLALHNSTGLYPGGGPYLELLGGTYNGHGPLERFRVSVVDREHPVTLGVTDLEIADEQHTPLPDTKRVHLLLESRSAGGTVAPAGWVREVGRGRVVYLANGHTRDALAEPMYARLIENAARWCLESAR